MAKQFLSMSPEQIAKVVGTVGSPLVVVAELIKNAVDASARKIDVYYDKENRTITVENDHKGFSSDEIQALSTPGSSAKKSDNNNLTNEHGMYFTGSKGLGLLSVFLLSDETEIITAPDDEKVHIITLNKKTGAIEDTVTNQKFIEHFTRITIRNVTQENMQFLSSPAEVRKLRHISSNLYKADKTPFPQMILHTDGQKHDINFSCTFPPMSYSAEFFFDKKSGTLTFGCISQGKAINSDIMALNKFDIESIIGKMISHYGINEKIKPRMIDDHETQQYDFSEVPSFEGRILVYDNDNAGQLKSYGAGVNVYVNDFALYNYLAEENDWLGLADFSQRKKATRLKPHNVFGYVNFPCFNENLETLQISNERADFIQNVTYIKLMYLIKGVIMFMLFNIDVADKKQKNAYKKDQKATNLNCSNDREDPTNVSTDVDDKPAENGATNANPVESGNRPLNEISSSDNSGGDSERSQSGGPRPGGPSPRIFFETISWHDKLDPVNREHAGLLFAISELYELSIKSCGRQKAYETFPVATGMILRTVYEQALRLRLKQENLWNSYSARVCQ